MYVYVPFRYKDVAVKLGAKWNNITKAYDISINHKNIKQLMKFCYENTDRTYLKIENNEARPFGAKYDIFYNCWYTHVSNPHYKHLTSTYLNLNKSIFMQSVY